MPSIPELERTIKREETALSLRLILRFLEAESPFWTEVEVRASGWLFCFFDLQVEPQYLSLNFYYLCYREVGPGFKAGTYRQELKQRPWRNALSWHVPPGLLSLLSHTSQDYLPRDATVPSTLGSLISPIMGL